MMRFLILWSEIFGDKILYYLKIKIQKIGMLRVSSLVKICQELFSI